MHNMMEPKQKRKLTKASGKKMKTFQIKYSTVNIILFLNTKTVAVESAFA